MRMRHVMAWGLGICGLLAALLAPGCAMYDRQMQGPVLYDSAESAATSHSSGQAPVALGVAGGLEALPAAPRPDERLLPARDEQLWIIRKAPRAEGQQAAEDDMPGTGMLIAPRAGKNVAVPLKHTDVHANITAFVASADVQQQFENPYDEKIEAVYVFPLPENAGVNGFVMTIGDRHIRGIIREREEAQQLYNEARQQGYVASLLTQERPNVFTQKVANIEPGKRIDIDIRYYHTLSYSDGSYEWVFPMVVGPRYNPAGTHDGVGAAPRGKPGATGQATEVQYLSPAERSSHDVAVNVTLDAGVPIEAIQSPSHDIRVRRPSESRAEVQLAETDRVPNKDFVLKWKVAGDRVKSGALVQADGHGGSYFALMLYPPAELASLPRRPVEAVFVIDSSGSMSGQPIEQAKAAVLCALDHLQPTDALQIVNFAGSAETWQRAPVAATPQNLASARQYVQHLSGAGGTEMLTGIHAALDFPHDAERTRVVTFLTDGYIGNEQQILMTLHDQLAGARVFSFGVGSAPNRYLLDGLARIGNGAVAYLGLTDDARPVMDFYMQRITHPALADVALGFGAARPRLFPAQAPALFVGRPVVVVGHSEGALPKSVAVRGSVGGKHLAWDVTLPTDRVAEGLDVVFTRQHIADLYDQWTIAPEQAHDYEGEIRQLALTHNLMSPWTSFVAVDSLTKTAGDHGTTVAVPVPVPEGVRYETTVGGGVRGEQ